MKNKTGSEQKRAFESILKQGRKPLLLQTDKGRVSETKKDQSL